MPFRRILVGIFALMLVVAPVTPAAAHHRDGHDGGPNGDVGVQSHNGGGNSGNVEDCKDDFAPGDKENDPPRNEFGQCVAEAAGGQAEGEGGEGNGNGEEEDELEQKIDDFCDFTDEEGFEDAGAQALAEDFCEENPEDVSQQEVDDFCEDIREEDLTTQEENEVEDLCE